MVQAIRESLIPAVKKSFSVDVLTALGYNSKLFGLHSLNAPANARNIVVPNMLRAFAHHVVCCCVLLRLVGSCWMKFDQFLHNYHVFE